MTKSILLLEFAATGLLIAGVCLPLILGWVGPNSWYGFRTQRSLADPKSWYAVNEVVGKRLAAAGLTIALGAIGFYFIPRWQVLHYVIANLAVTLFSLGYALFQCTVFVKKLEPVQKQRPAA